MSFSYRTFVLLLCAAGLPLSAAAQATRTWVSGVGDDANPCSRTAPCLTWAGAISKTAAGGEIDALDPGDFGAVTITKAITIAGWGDLATIMHTSGNGINVVAGAADTVVLKNLLINGNKTGTYGIQYTSAKQVVLENVLITNEATAGVRLSPSSAALNLSARNVSMSTSVTAQAGINVAAGLGANVELRNVSIEGFASGVILNGGVLDVADSAITQNSGDAINIVDGKGHVTLSSLTNNGTAAETTGATAFLSIERSTIAANNQAIVATAGTIRIHDNSIYENKTGISCGLNAPFGTVASTGTNRKANNVGGAYPVCGSVTPITFQ
ncbi:hypothetical protein AB4Y89_23180 [Terriglobus sp. 2YAB30_2]|uniref:hypothetical protein n=1 Tax=Terriglobus sp. 2YAB30_2 TaxID=3233023 RepID=UPI003F9673E2